MNHFLEYKNALEGLFSKRKSQDVFRCMSPEGDIRRKTYKTLQDEILGFGRNLDEWRLGRGDRVLILDSHSPSVMQAFLTVTYWNLTPIMMDAGLPAAEIESLVAMLEPSAIFTSLELLQKLPDSARTSLPVRDIRDPEHCYPVLDGCSDTPLSVRPADADPEIAVIILSSGTTGKMKAAMISYRAFNNMTRQNVKISGIRPGDDMLLVFPLFHISGLASAMTVLAQGNALMMLDAFHPAELQRALQTFQPQVFGMVPKVFEIMVQKLEQELETKGKLVQGYYRTGTRIASFFNRKFGISSVGKVLLRPFATALFGKNIKFLPVGASSCDPHTAETLLNMGLRWYYVYASTECGVPITAVALSDHYPLDTPGRTNSVEGVDIVIHHPDVKGIGEVYVKTDLIMTEYFRDPELTAESFDHGYFKTGDLGYIDPQGYLHIVGRSKESIQLQTGKKVSPADLELVLLQAACPYEVAVCGVPDGDSGFDRIHIFVRDANYDEDAKEAAQATIRQIFREEAAQYPIDQIHFIPEIPKTAVGKVKRVLLRQQVLGDVVVPKRTKKEPTKFEGSTQEELTAWIVTLFAANEGADEGLGAQTQWKQIRGIDSLATMEILAAIEKDTGVFIGENIVKLQTIGDIASFVHERQGSAAKNR